MKKILLPALGVLLAAGAAQAQNTKPAAGGQATDPNHAQTTQGTGINQVGNSIPAAAYYEGGQQAMYDFIAKEIKYPLLAKRNRMQGRCIVSFTLNTDGTMQGIKLVKGVGGGTGEEALRVVRLLKFKKPEYPILTSLPIDFKLGVTGANALEN
ncbi:MAG TPA: energy transducer TonB [Hymenobacter sp.]|uniref:energy transducer TonB n=1 Tax=Hymenobacter sp. TaxID=1898978 RepID=UPI002D7F47DD|nr:energy transducer TonB [Hymenobacter sp.]HET9502767.1 energy transducer TonB [Hymenobacter sp.]